LQFFGAWVKEQRGERGLAEVARRAGMTSQQWQRLEKHSRHPQRETVEKVARGLGLPSEVVLSAAGYGVEGDERALRLGRRLDRVLQMLSPEVRDRVEEALVEDAEKYVDLLRTPLE
jgi:transcriptional regulator with XRE-family HTH domain